MLGLARLARGLLYERSKQLRSVNMKIKALWLVMIFGVGFSFASEKSVVFKTVAGPCQEMGYEGELKVIFRDGGLNIVSKNEGELYLFQSTFRSSLYFMNIGDKFDVMVDADDTRLMSVYGEAQIDFNKKRFRYFTIASFAVDNPRECIADIEVR